jgi:hypothetical protein
VRVSVGLVSNFADVYHFVQFARDSWTEISERTPLTNGMSWR